MSPYVSNFILSSIIQPNTLPPIFAALISHKSDVLLSSIPVYPHLLRYSQLGRGEGKAILPLPPLVMCVCVNCATHSGVTLCRLLCSVWHVIADKTVYAGVTGLFLPLWRPDLPALIRFHLGWTAHTASYSLQFRSELNGNSCCTSAVTAQWLQKASEKHFSLNFISSKQIVCSCHDF